MKEALFYRKEAEEKVQCTLCPQLCEIRPGKSGSCRVRKNVNGKLFSEVYGKVASMAIDPIEKKPLYHFFPGMKILSVGNVGCNLHCIFCQNHDISQCSPDDFHWFKAISPEHLVEYALKIDDNIGIAYTYNEPFTFYEFMLETAIKTKLKGLRNAVVSNGFINEEPLKSILPYLDAFNIDLKGFSEDFYLKITKGSLAPVLKTLKIIAESNAHLEITNLVVPGLNDDKNLFREMVLWIAGELGPDIPLHLSRYFPRYRLSSPPTSAETLDDFYLAAKDKLRYVYVGNIETGNRSDTFCPECGSLLISRSGYFTKINLLGNEGECTNCGLKTCIILK
jgi:pyruvate formate lyase activating enzyme